MTRRFVRSLAARHRSRAAYAERAAQWIVTARTRTAFKAVRPDGFDLFTGSVRYDVGAMVTAPTSAHADGETSGPGLYCLRTLIALHQLFPSSNASTHRFLEVQFDAADLLGARGDLFRVRRLYVVREVFIR